MIESQGPVANTTAPKVRSLTKRRADHKRAAPLARPLSPGPAGHGQVRILIRSNADILEARRHGRELARRLGFSSIDCTLIATAISELSRNIVLYAGHGEICVGEDHPMGATGIVITAVDHGPGIRDVRSALQDGYSTSRGLGLGLPGVKRIMDEFEVTSKLRQGTTVTVKKWKSN